MPKGEPTRAELQAKLDAAEAALAARPEVSAASDAPLLAKAATDDEADEFLEDEREEEAETPEERKRRLAPLRKRTTWTLPQTIVNGRPIPRPVTVQGKTYTPGKVYTTSAELAMTVMAAWGANRDAEALLMVDRGITVNLGSVRG